MIYHLISNKQDIENMSNEIYEELLKMIDEKIKN